MIEKNIEAYEPHFWNPFAEEQAMERFIRNVSGELNYEDIPDILKCR